MPISDPEQEKAFQEENLRIRQQIAFASGVFQGDITIRTLLESLAEGVVIIDSHGIILLVNACAEQMFGYQKKDLIGKPHAVLIPERFRKIHEEHQAHFFEELRVRPMGLLLDLAGRRQDGSEFPLEISLSFLETINGVLVLAFVSDITLRKQLETSLKEGEELFHVMVECVKDYAIYMLDSHGYILNWNVGAERLKGYRSEEVIGKHFSCFYTEKDRSDGKPEEELKKASAEGQFTEECWRVRKDGSGFWADVVITALRDESGKLWGFSKVAHDITERKKAEKEREQLLMELEAVLENINEAVVITDLNANVIKMNGAALILHGYQRDDVHILRPLAEYQDTFELSDLEGHPIPFEDWPLVRALRGESFVTCELRVLRKDTGKSWIGSYNGSQVRSKSDNIVLAVITVRDITEHKKAEEALRESEQRFASFMLYLPAAAWMKDLDGRYVYANAEAKRIFSTPLSELQGKTDEELFPQETARQFRENDERVLVEDGHLQTIEVLQQANHIERHSIVNKFSVPGPGGQTAFIAGIAVDITDLQRAKEGLRESEERLRFASEAADIGMWHWDLENNELTWDIRCKEFFGYPPDFQMTCEVFLQPIHEEDRQQIHEAVQKALQGKKEYSAEMRVVLPDGELRWVMSKGRAVYNEQGKPVRMDGIAMDITESKRAEDEILRLNANLTARAEELSTANQDLEAFNYTVAHDLRQPLNIINSCCQVIEKLCGDKLDDDCKEHVEMAYNGTLRMNRLIEALLNFSRMGRVEPRRELIDLSVISQELVGNLKQTEPERQVDFQIADGIKANADANLLRVVLDNLFGNAWKYSSMREKAVIEFGVNDIAGVQAYFVKDNGAGFDMAEADKLFIPFERLPGAEKQRGFGIGLATVERIIQKHGGKVWAEGELDKGATFYFTLSAG